jgi:hypothetical protein
MQRPAANPPELPAITPREDWLIRVSISEQTATVLQEGRVVGTYPISSSKFGLGFTPGSFCTPTGRFVIAEKIGDGLPLGAVLRAREFTGEIFPLGQPGATSEEDLILTRIFRLHGLDEPNQNTWERFIYFHGTNQENLLGQPASHGCIRFKNTDMIQLFDLVPCGTVVEIA